jgi:hypothetical protein
MYCTSKQNDVLVMALWSLMKYSMIIIYSYIIYLDRGTLPKRGNGKTSGWEEVHKRIFKDLGRIPAWRRGISGKTPACEQEHYLIQKGFCENSRLGKGISGKTSGFIRETYSRLVSDIPAGGRENRETCGSQQCSATLKDHHMFVLGWST